MSTLTNCGICQDFTELFSFDNVETIVIAKYEYPILLRDKNNIPLILSKLPSLTDGNCYALLVRKFNVNQALVIEPLYNITKGTTFKCFT